MSSHSFPGLPVFVDRGSVPVIRALDAEALSVEAERDGSLYLLITG